MRAGPAQLDWANQPDPFRRYEGAPLTRLPLLAPDDEPLSPALRQTCTAGRGAERAASIRALSRLLEYSLALSAWKQAGGTRWALRVQPVERQPASHRGLPARRRDRRARRRAGVYHYAPREHALERRADCPLSCSRDRCAAFRAQASSSASRRSTGARRGSTASARSATASTTSGHAIGARAHRRGDARLAALVLDGVADETIDALLGLDRAEDFDGRRARKRGCSSWRSGPGRAGAQRNRSALDPRGARADEAALVGKANRLSARRCLASTRSLASVARRPSCPQEPDRRRADHPPAAQPAWPATAGRRSRPSASTACSRA